MTHTIPNLPASDEPITRATWEAMWSALREAMHGDTLTGAAPACDRIKAAWRAQYPDVDFSNGRYEVYLEDALRRGIPVTPAMIASVSADDIRFDAYAFPLLAPLLQGGAARVRPP